MSKILEKPFEYLKRRKEEDEKEAREFDSDVIKNWYCARAFALDKLGHFAFAPDDNSHLHVIIDGDSSLMLSLARQVALITHYINYDEENKNEGERKRTVITVVSAKDNILTILKNEEYLSNLLYFCKYTVDGNTHNENSYIDVEFIIERKTPTTDKDSKKEIEFKFQEDEIKSFCNSKTEDELYTIDTQTAQYAGRMYNLGTLIENLPAENIHDADRYTLALNAFQYDKLQNPLGLLINKEKWEKDQISVKKGLSNIFCADCFESRAKSMEFCRKNQKMKDSELWAKYNELLCKSEHARWVVEKLIMGFRPLNDNERFEDEKLATDTEKREKYHDSLKNDLTKLVHIDLCSYKDLRRVNPDNMKYDSFLMLAIPKILEKIH